MTKEEAIELLDNLIGMVEDNQGNDYDAALKMAIAALREPQWIPCSERLPEPGSDYFASVLLDDGRKDVYILFFCEEPERWDDHGVDPNSVGEKVVAWMPITTPEPFLQS